MPNCIKKHPQVIILCVWNNVFKQNVPEQSSFALKFSLWSFDWKKYKKIRNKAPMADDSEVVPILKSVTTTIRQLK